MTHHYKELSLALWCAVTIGWLQSPAPCGGWADVISLALVSGKNLFSVNSMDLVRGIAPR